MLKFILLSILCVIVTFCCNDNNDTKQEDYVEVTTRIECTACHGTGFQTPFVMPMILPFHIPAVLQLPKFGQICPICNGLGYKFEKVRVKYQTYK